MVQWGSLWKIVRNEAINIEALVVCCLIMSMKTKTRDQKEKKKFLCFWCNWWHGSRILPRDMWLDLAALMWGRFYLAENKQTITTTHLTFALLKFIEWLNAFSSSPGQASLQQGVLGGVTGNIKDIWCKHNLEIKSYNCIFWHSHFLTQLCRRVTSKCLCLLQNIHIKVASSNVFLSFWGVTGRPQKGLLSAQFFPVGSLILHGHHFRFFLLIWAIILLL